MLHDKKCFLGFRIVQLSISKEKELEKICEIPIIKKLGLSEKFPIKILHAENENLGLGLMQPNTIISILATKLYIVNMRLQGKLDKIKKTNK